MRFLCLNVGRCLQERSWAAPPLASTSTSMPSCEHIIPPSSISALCVRVSLCFCVCHCEAGGHTSVLMKRPSVSVCEELENTVEGNAFKGLGACMSIDAHMNDELVYSYKSLAQHHTRI